MKNRQPIILQGDDTKWILSQPYRPIPHQFCAELSTHLEHLRKNGKIVDVDPNKEKVESYSNVVISRKPSGKLRMNLDARPINAALHDIVFPRMKTPEDVRHEISGSTRFSEFDMNHGYNQSQLSEESSKKYAVFQTHEGFHRFRCLYFGHKQASQAFDADVTTSLRGLKQTTSVADNIMVHGKTGEEHIRGLINFLDRCLQEGITLTMVETNICEPEMLWFGYMFGKEGVRPDPAKVKLLKEKGKPTIQEEVRSFLQAAQFNARFMWDIEAAYAHITQPLRKLLGKNVPFEWGTEQDASYKEKSPLGMNLIASANGFRSKEKSTCKYEQSSPTPTTHKEEPYATRRQLQIVHPGTNYQPHNIACTYSNNRKHNSSLKLKVKHGCHTQ